ncbi:MAG: T9SS type A sorting domain-containing protein [Bacteroidales bacterium]
MRIVLTFILVISGFLILGQTQRALFLGNSYTNVNSLPQLTADVASSAGDTLVFDSNTPGGYTLEGHSTNTVSLEKIMQGKWDFVVLQEQSQRPSFPINQVMEDVFPYARILDSIINAYNPCGETMFYMTWGRKNGDVTNCPNWPPVCTYEGMDSLLHLRYMMMADSNNAVVSPVGAVWKFIRENHPEIELYSADESHPSSAGSYAAACSFYTAIFRKDPELITYDFTLNPMDAANIRAAAKQMVFDSLLHWHIGEYDLFSDFSYSQISGYTYQFLNQSLNSIGQHWDFGTATDTSANPAYTFPEQGTYSVQLASFNYCDTIVSSKEIVVVSTNILENNFFDDFFVYPNPAQDILSLNRAASAEVSVNIYNLFGEIVMTYENLEVNEIHIGLLRKGLYYLTVELGGKIITRKFIKN